MEINPREDRLIGLIDVSSEDDCLISSSSNSGFSGNQNDHEYFELSEVGISQETELSLNSFVEREKKPMLPETSEPERTRKTGKCNLRKSLAWDSAFFTSAGVLEPEELSIINCGLKGHPLPGIEEDIRRSTESNSTLDSDILNLESLEVDLFEDVRASIQRSTKASNTEYSSNQAAQAEAGKCVQSLESSRKMEFAFRSKPMAASKRQTVNTQGLERTKKELVNTKMEADKFKREALGTKKEAVVRARAVQATARSGLLNTSSLRPPKVAGQVSPAPTSPTKSTSLGANRVKPETNTVRSFIGRRENVVGPKRPGFGDPRVTTRATSSPKSSSSSSVSGTKTPSVASCSSHNRSDSTSSDSTDKSPITSLGKKTNGRNVNLPSASTLKPPLRVSSKSRTETQNSRLSAYLMSVSKLSSSISPASSLDGWSSESSSSTSVKQYLNSAVNSLDISSPCKEFYSERGSSQSEMQKHQHDQRSLEQKRTDLPIPGAKKSISGAGLRTRSAATEVSRSSKPSGLRMPSPKIGFFDAEKSTESTHSGNLQVHPGVRSSLRKHGTGVDSIHGEGTRDKPGKLQFATNMTGEAIRDKSGKLQPATCMTGRSSLNCIPHLDGVPHCASSMRHIRPGQLHGSSLASPKVSATKPTRVNCPSMTIVSESDVRTVRGSHLTGEVGAMNNTNRKILGSFLNIEDNIGQDAFPNDMDTTSEQASAAETPTDCPGITSKLQHDMCRRTGRVRHWETGEVGESTNVEKDCLNSPPNEDKSGDQNSILHDIGTEGKEVSATITNRENQNVASEQSFSTLGTCSEMNMRTGEVREVMTNSENISRREGENSCQDGFMKENGIENCLETGVVGGLVEETGCSSFYLNKGGNSGQASLIHDIGTVSEKSSPSKVTRENQDVTSERNDLYHRTGSAYHMRTGGVRELMKTESAILFPEEGENSCQDAFVNDIGIHSKRLPHVSSIINDSTSIVLQVSCKHSSESDCNCDNKITSTVAGEIITHDPGHLDINLRSCQDTNGKENLLSHGNQTDGLRRHIKSIHPNMEEFTAKKDSSSSQFDGMTDSLDQLKLLLSNSREGLIHDQDGTIPKVLSKDITHSLSTNSVDILPRTRTPLAANMSLCNETDSSEFASESTTEMVPTYSTTEGVHTANK